MALEKTVSVDSVNVKASGHLEVRNVVSITEDGAVISSSYSRYVIDPGAPVPADVEAYLREKLLGESPVAP